MNHERLFFKFCNSNFYENDASSVFYAFETELTSSITWAFQCDISRKPRSARSLKLLHSSEDKILRGLLSEYWNKKVIIN